MPSVQVKDVPEDVHATLRRRAAAAGQSPQEYLLQRLMEDARTPTTDEVLDRAGGRAGGSACEANGLLSLITSISRWCQHGDGYVALTEALETTLLTADVRLARAPGSMRPVEVLG